MSIGRVLAATGGGHMGPHACRVNATGEPAGAGGAGATARRSQALKDGALLLAFAGPPCYLRFNSFFTRLISLVVQYLILRWPTLIGLGAVIFPFRIHSRSVEGLTPSALANSGVVLN